MTPHEYNLKIMKIRMSDEERINREVEQLLYQMAGEFYNLGIRDAIKIIEAAEADDKQYAIGVAVNKLQDILKKKEGD